MLVPNYNFLLFLNERFFLFVCLGFFAGKIIGYFSFEDDSAIFLISYLTGDFLCQALKLKKKLTKQREAHRQLNSSAAPETAERPSA